MRYSRQVWMWEVDGEQFPETASEDPIACIARLGELAQQEPHCEEDDAADTLAAFLEAGRFVRVPLDDNLTPAPGAEGGE